MKTLTFREPRLVALILLTLLAAGLSSLLSIARQEDPTITNLFATVTTPFPGADPARVEALVTVEIEEALEEIAEIDVIDAVSSTGVSIIRIELGDRVPDGRIEGVWSEVRDALEEAQREFPDGAQEAELFTDGSGTFGGIIALTAEEGLPLSIVGRHGEALADRLRNITNTKLVEVYGAPDEEILVTLDAARTASLGLTADDVSRAIRAADMKGQSGNVRTDGGDLIVDVAGDIEALERVRRVIVEGGDEGAVTRIADIAEVTRGPRTPMDEKALYGGRPTVVVATKLEDDRQVDVWMTDVRQRLSEFQDTLPTGITATLVFDQSGYTTDRLMEVGTNMAIGVALVVGVLVITLGFRAAAIVALVLPVVSLATLATMNAMGLAIHQMSVTGLIVALGLLVDAAIVMTDEIGRRLRAGLSRLEAVGEAVQRLAAPLFASTATTALSFVPMMLLPGPAGDFVGSIATAVVIMLCWSFVIAMAVTPAIAGWLLPAQEGRGTLSTGIQLPALAAVFRRSLSLAVRNPLRAVSLALVLPVLGLASLPLLTAQFFPGVDRDQFHIEIDLGPGASIAKTEDVALRIDGALADASETRSVLWVIGSSAPAFYYNITGGRSDTPRYAQALVTTQSPEATEALLPRLQDELGALAPEAQVLVRGLVQGPPVDAPVELRIVGPDVATLREIEAEARGVIAGLPTVTVARGTVINGAPKVAVELNEPKAERLGIDPASAARQLQAGLEGVAGGSLLEDTEELPVRVRYGAIVRGDLNAVRDLPILPADARAIAASGAYPGVPLSAIADITLEPSAPRVTRRNGERVNTIQAFVLRDVLPEEALVEVRAALDEAGFALPPGYRLELGGDSDARSDTLNNLLSSLGIIIALSLAAIVMTFNSFRLTLIALVVSVLSAGLSLLALAVFQYPFGINAIIGVIGSIGVSINAAIIILTGLKADEDARRGSRPAMVRVVMGSSRHIVSTTITTFGGFLPLILAGGGFWPPFAMAVAGGVLLSTVVSFYFTPPMFALLYAGREAASVAPSRARPALVSVGTGKAAA